ncbi:hypothetical protein BCR41DRAFT_297863 [Lobosporangium transversale]|uniref:NAD(P)-binding protein n=1 Tax=Lobosporangium transversale TaxID=64571 RepID=A0A1Y2H2Q9_9FUNG|nr:hypothetical protein BCR41DRAFT_297863 [Lobosporangium transversale]ORZ28828.1 hypothetical protein BCR41DRAFT_297863 [Lobosporangium transversale]|eukprot:XP_021886501.1 hypothetical protein BCR41DRAFT_297863 [Lobosporangium transversale]
MFASSFFRLQYWKTFITPNQYSHKQIPDLTDKVAIVTGANSGLGYASTVALAAHGAHVFLACRSQQRAMDAIKRAKEDIKEVLAHLSTEIVKTEPKLEFLELDLNDMAKARDSARNFLAKNLPIHILICNAGINLTPFELSANGIETQFAVNHMGHFVFATALLERIKESQPSRIVIVSSMSHEVHPPGGIDFETLNDVTNINVVQRYARSKLANLLFGKALARRLSKERVYVNIAEPGYTNTAISRHTKDVYGTLAGKLADFMNRWVAKDPKMACLTQLYLATSPEVESMDIRGRYFIPIANELNPSK